MLLAFRTRTANGGILSAVSIHRYTHMHNIEVFVTNKRNIVHLRQTFKCLRNEILSLV